MIAFFNDHLAPPEVCRLLYQSIDEEHHCPVIFLTLPDPHTSWTLGSYWGDCITIHLNSIYRATRTKGVGAPSASLWRQLLSTSFHEFGHHVERDAETRLPQRAYSLDDRAHHFVEALAVRWSERKLNELRDYDTRLCQPRSLRGYLGGRLVKEFDVCIKEPFAGNRFSKERRCYKTGGQLSPGDVLTVLGLDKERFPKAYRALRQVTRDIGTEYVDRAGRKHRIYTWGDVPMIGQRIGANSTLVKLFSPKPTWRPIWDEEKNRYGVS